MTEKRNYGITLFVIFLFLVCSAAASADFSGKVVAVKDGDTLEVMKEGGAVRQLFTGANNWGNCWRRYRNKHLTLGSRQGTQCSPPA